MSLTRDTIRKVMDELQSIGARSANFSQVIQHEPKAAPEDFWMAVYLQSMRPASSGLISTSIRAEFSIRLYQDMLAEPRDAIDAFVAAATWDIIDSIHQDLTLGGLVELVDVLGKDGEPLSAEAGYVDIGGKLFRVTTINVPVKINDAFDQEV
jgi:hypothetical protein